MNRILNLLRFDLPPEGLQATLDIYADLSAPLKSCGDGCCNLGHGAFIFDDAEDSRHAAERVKTYLSRKGIGFLSLPIHAGELVTTNQALIDWCQSRGLLVALYLTPA